MTHACEHDKGPAILNTVMSSMVIHTLVIPSELDIYQFLLIIDLLLALVITVFEFLQYPRATNK